ncbi:Fic family protein [Streptomyces sp. NPDC096012]|uniref:Fic family protein n=1 Tax=Streptomyces sp. NPDC096012 TaxID=3155684 RepID=UPI00336A5BC3
MGPHRRNLILHVTDRTGCGSGWYAHCHQVLGWFLSRWGIPADDAEHLVEQAIGGRFESWTGPDPVLIEDIAERLAAAVRPDAAARAGESTLPDHLTRWLTVRDAVPWHEAADSTGDTPVTPVRDGMAEEIRTFDAILDPTHGRGLLTALDLMRADAAHGARLDFALIQRWQQHILATPGLPPLRSLPAFAKGGRERYGIAPDTRARLDACLAESAKDTARPLPLTARAARAFLDVCFFHPFDDGNARCALLTLLFVLAREDVALDSVQLLGDAAFAVQEELQELDGLLKGAAGGSERVRGGGEREGDHQLLLAGGEGLPGGELAVQPGADLHPGDLRVASEGGGVGTGGEVGARPGSEGAGTTAVRPRSPHAGRT